ncbi:MAG: rod shape-determining protein RodA [Deltaproteobacteria bacterium]|nr:rod shape-determining protein RodA [Deltaproteobacteria bacterium]
MNRPRGHLVVISTVCLLVFVGAVNLYSALFVWGGGGRASLIWQHGIWIGVGSVLCALLMRYDYRRLQRSSGVWHGVVVGLLVLVLLVGRTIGGNKSWLAIGGFGIQPSEFAKLTTIMMLAAYGAERVVPHGYGLRELWRPLCWLGVPTGLIALQHDAGTTLCMGLLSGSLLLFARVRRYLVLTCLGLSLLGAGIAYRTMLGPAQRARIETFLHPESDPRGRGYHLIQSKVAVGSGGWFGRGFRQGQVNKLRFLPEKHTDFVFPVLAEEWGFLGALCVLGLYFVLLLAGLQTARTARDRFGALLAVGIVCWLFWQIAINIGGVLGLIPLTGIALPFLSYGGSSTLMTFVAMGLLLSVYRRRFLFPES